MRPSPRTSAGAGRSAPRAASTSTGRRSSTCGAASGRPATREPWREDTMVLVFSSTKGLAAMTMALAHSRGWLDYEERVATYWPEFAQHGKERITVRQLLAHQAGLFGFDEPVDRAAIADLDRLAAIMARQRPAWEPGERQAYHAISLGFYESEILRRVDPRHRSLGQVLRRRDRRSARARVLHPAAGIDPRRPARAAHPAEHDPAADRPAVPAPPGLDEPALGPLPLAHLQPRDPGPDRPRADLRPRPRDPVGRRRRHGPRHRPGLRRRSPPAGTSSASVPTRSRRSGRRPSRRGSASATSACGARCSSRSAS